MRATQAGLMTFYIALIYLTFGSCGSSLASTDLSRKNILILHSMEGNAPIFRETDKGLSNTLLSGGIPSLNQYFESLDLRRNPGPENRKLLVEQMRVRYGHRKIDLLITMYPEALDFVLEDCKEVFAGPPVIALYMQRSMEKIDRNRRVIAHTATVEVVGTLEIALRLVPRAKRVYVVSGSHEVDKRIAAQARQDLKKWEGQLEFLYLSEMPLGDIEKTIAAAPPESSIVLLLSFGRDVTGKNTITPDVAQRLSIVSSAPIFGITEVSLRHGIVGGSLLSFELVGQKAGLLTLDILRGTKTPDNLPNVLDALPVPMFDWRQLKRWDLDGDAMPQGSVVINREFRFWDYKYYILGFLAFCLLETALIVILVVQRRRKQITENALREREEQLDLATSAAGEGVWIMRMDTGAIWVTDKLRELFQFARNEELTFNRFMESIHPDDRKIVRESVMKSQKTREPMRVEYRILHPDGATHWIVSRGRFYSGGSGRPDRLMGVSNDITERKTTELRLRESQTLLSTLVDSTSDMIWSVDAERFGLLTFNRGLSHYFLKERGLRIEVGMNPEVLLPTKGYAEKWCAFYRRSLEQGSFTTEYPVYSGTRTLLLTLNRLERDGIVFGVSVFGKDITDRKKAEKALMESEGKYRSLYESMMDGYVQVDMSGKIVNCNDIFRSFTGYSHDELAQMTHRDITPEKWLAAEEEIIEQQVFGRGYSEVYEKEYRKKDGTVLSVELRTFHLKDEKGNNIGMWSIVRDIGERKQIELEARKLREELAHVTRVSTLGELTSSLAHEINQPLAAILSNAQAAQRFLVQENPDMKEIAEILRDIIRDDNRAADVIRKIRALMKKEDTRFEALILNDVIEEILNLIRNDTVLMTLRIENSFDSTLPAVRGDRIQLQQVILNLMINAAEATRDMGAEGHILTIKTSKKDERFAEVSVMDRGSGIDENSAGKLFEPFYTTKSGGMGMGLAISRQIVSSHKGEIRAVNNPDGGATISFTVPFDAGGKP